MKLKFWQGVIMATYLLYHLVTTSTDWHYSGNNIARQKYVEQEPGTYRNYRAELAIDGNNDTSFGSGSCTHTSLMHYGHASWTIHLGRDYYITGILLFNRDEQWQRIRLQNFIVFGNNDYVIYNDTGKTLYLEAEIRIPLDGKHSFSVITIQIPPHSGSLDGGQSILTLCEVEIFAATPPHCGSITQPLNGGIRMYPMGLFLQSDTYPAGTVFEFFCNNHYSIRGPTYIECLPDGHYNASVPTCDRAACEGFQPSNHRHFSPNNTSYPINTNLIIYCDKGYKINSSTNSIRCQGNGVWDRSLPTCNPVQCFHPGKPAHGYYIQILPNYNDVYYNFSTLPYGSLIRGSCDIGYEANENVERKCESNKSWTGQNPSCYPVRCKDPGRIKNGVYVFGNGSQYASGTVVYNTVFSIMCNAGYQIEGQNQTRCQGDKTWSTTHFVCTIKICETPRLFQNGYYAAISQNPSGNGNLIPINKNTKFEYLARVYVQCIRGNTRNSTGASRTCLESGTWSGETPVCMPVMCKWPLYLQGGHYIPTHNASQTGMPFNTTLKAVCNNKSKLYSNKWRRCDENGDWSNEQAVCVPLCLLPNVSNAQVASGMPALYEKGLSIRVVCDEGFTLSPDQNITCLDKHEWSGTPRCLAQTKTDEQGSDKSGMIAGVSVSILLVLLTIAALAIFFYRRRKQKIQQKADVAMRYCSPTSRRTENSSLAEANEYAQIQDESVDNDLDDASIQKEAGPATKHDHTYSNTLLEKPEKYLRSDGTYCNFTHENEKPTTAIKVKDLSDLVLYGRDAKDNFEKQFKRLPQGMVESHTEALKLQNRGKNRYRNLYAYDDTRVILDTEDGSQSDYINACYVKGFGGTQKYIASQAPTKDILTDFWKMVWKEDCCKIVMLTNLYEEGKTKCEQYWPDGGSLMCGKITVTMKATEIFSQFVIRTLTVLKENSAPRTISQFHFTAWPDKGVPKHASSLVQFLHKVKHAPCVGRGPILVHCSAGVGRTGTFIALDILTDQGNTMDSIDAVSTVTALRKQRVNLVQTLEQYIFVHHALVESLMLSTSALPAAKFPATFQELLELDQTKKKRKICLEFETLKKMSPVAEEGQYVSAKLVQNRQKNRYSNVLPVEDFMPKLTSDDGTTYTSYINAVFLPSYKEKRAFIITQTPLESTIADFWRLIWEHDIHTVVMMNNREDLQDSEIYWPGEGKEVRFGNLVIRSDGTDDINKHKLLSLTIKYHQMTRCLKIIQCGGWYPQRGLPDSTDVILSLMELVLIWQQQTGNHTILVHCMNGVDKSGLFCVISAVIERMKIEQDVAIPQVIEEMRNAREQLIPSVVQYKFCHEAILTFLQQYDTYANFAG